MKDYIFTNEIKSGSFSCPITCIFEGASYNALAEVDTGASTNLFPLRTLGYNEDEAMALKRKLIRDNVPCRVLRGVEGSYNLTKEDIEKMSFDEKLKCKGLVFRTDMQDLTISDCPVGDITANVNCDTTGNILIGMDIWKFHLGIFGKSSIDEKLTFISCDRLNFCRDFYEELEKHFGLYTTDAIKRIMLKNSNELKRCIRSDIRAETIKQQKDFIIDSAMKEFYDRVFEIAKQEAIAELTNSKPRTNLGERKNALREAFRNFYTNKLK